VPLETQRIRVLVVDDHAGMRDGIRAVVNAQPDMVVAGEASDGHEAIEQFRTLQPDVSIVDWNLPKASGEEVIAALRKEFPEARFIVITALNDDDCVRRAIGLGAMAYIHKDLLRRALLSGIRAVNQGQPFFPEKNPNTPKKEA
jgi:two-component system, NarL family, response regulator